MAKIAAIQISSGPTVSENLEKIATQVGRASEKGANLVALPESFAALGTNVKEVAQQEWEIVDFIQTLAKKHGIWVVAGTIPTLSDVGGKKSRHRCWASSLIFDNQGVVVGRYDKIHLFDGDVSDNRRVYRESTDYRPGDSFVVVDTPVGRLGMSVCYDVRFPELYRKLAEEGAQIFCVPSAFTAVTGKAHWKVLLRARAIENQCYVLAPNQCGTHYDGRETWGHSLIVDPWGSVVVEASKNRETFICADMDDLYQKEVRHSMPCLSHRRF